MKRQIGEPGLRASAAIALARRGDDSIKESSAKRLERTGPKSDVAAYEICLALFGEPRYLRPEHFRVGSSTIGFSGLVAIERFKGKHGMEALVQDAFHHPHGEVCREARLVYERITGKKPSDS